MHINDLLAVAVGHGASDIHLKAGNYPVIRVNGKLTRLSDFKWLRPDDTAAFAAAIMSPAQYETLRQLRELDLAYSVSGVGRFRCSVFYQRGTIAMVLRILPMEVKSIDQLGLPAVVKKIAQEERGLVLVTGTTGSGKSSTLAAIVEFINTTRDVHTMMIEDPIEFLHRDNRSIINQREVSSDTRSFAKALRGALRQDPDVILLGEMRDRETAEIALIAAETGHLVLSTLHTLDATETIHRLISIFPTYQRKQVRIQLATVLKAVISQRLLPLADNSGRVVAAEVMVSTPLIRDCIVDKERTTGIRDAIAAGTSEYGMQTFDQSILWLYERKAVSYEEALRWASNVDEFKLRVQGIGTTTDLAREQMARKATGFIGEITRSGQ